MAAVAAGAVGEVAALLGGTGIGATLARGALGGVAAIAAADLIKAIQSDLGGGNPQAAATARRVPQYAIVDLHNNKTVRFLSSHKVYVMLTHGRRRRHGRSPKLITVPSGSSVVEVR